MNQSEIERLLAVLEKAYEAAREFIQAGVLPTIEALPHPGSARKFIGYWVIPFGEGDCKEIFLDKPINDLLDGKVKRDKKLSPTARYRKRR